MKKSILLTIASFILVILFSSCGESNSSSEDNEIKSIEVSDSSDSIAIVKAFEKTKKNPKFLKDLDLKNEQHYSFYDAHPNIIQGNLDEITKAALVFFSIESRGGVNNWDAHYALLIHQNNQWEYITYLDAGGDWGERILELKEIKEKKIFGTWVGNKDESLAKVPTEYVFKNNQLINIFTALHKEENITREYLFISEIMSSDYILIPLSGKLKDYEKLLGKGKITTPKEQELCGTYFDEGILRFLDYPNIHLELNAQNEVGLISINMEGNYLLQTDKGTITSRTTLENLKRIFYKKDSWMVFDGENGITTFGIPDGEESDNQWHFEFDQKGKLIKVSLFIPC